MFFFEAWECRDVMDSGSCGTRNYSQNKKDRDNNDGCTYYRSYPVQRDTEKSDRQSAAIKTALEYIRQHLEQEEFIGIMDADGQHLPQDMVRFISFAEENRDALVLGVRSVGREMPWKSRMGNRITRTVFRTKRIRKYLTGYL